MRTWCGSTAQPGQRLRALLGWARFIVHGGLWKKKPAQPAYDVGGCDALNPWGPPLVPPWPGRVTPGCGQPERDRDVLRQDVQQFLEEFGCYRIAYFQGVKRREGGFYTLGDVLIAYGQRVYEQTVQEELQAAGVRPLDVAPQHPLVQADPTKPRDVGQEWKRTDFLDPHNITDEMLTVFSVLASWLEIENGMGPQFQHLFRRIAQLMIYENVNAPRVVIHRPLDIGALELILDTLKHSPNHGSYSGDGRSDRRVTVICTEDPGSILELGAQLLALAIRPDVHFKLQEDPAPAPQAPKPE